MMKCKQLGGTPIECAHQDDSDLQCNNCGVFNSARLRSKSASGEPQICQHDSGLRCIHTDWGACSGCSVFENDDTPEEIITCDEAFEVFFDLVVGDYLYTVCHSQPRAIQRKFIAGVLLTAQKVGIDPEKYDVDSLLRTEEPAKGREE